MDALMMARMQFAANISFHILFPVISMALAWVLFYFKMRYRYSHNEAWLKAYATWVKVFALTFALGVVSGITMSFQFGTNWPGFMEKVGNVAGPLLAYEVLTAFFLEATFLGIMLFGQQRVPAWLHTLSTLLVAGGTTLSAFWILVLNSWMHTPAGFELRDGVVHATDWMAIIFNPSFPYRFFHMELASALTVAFLIAGMSAYRWQKGDHSEEVRLTMKSGVFIAAILIPVQIFVGDLHGLNTLHHSPQKIAAMEGIWETERGAPLLLFAIPDEQSKSNHYEIGIPHGAAMILKHSMDGELQGLADFEHHPPVAPLFFGFRIMVGVGTAMLAMAWWAAWQLHRRKSLSVWAQRGLVAMTFSGWVATLSGWYVTEIGRQPWLVNGVLLTADAAGPAPQEDIAITLVMYLSTYAILLAAYIWTLYYLARKASRLQAGTVPAFAHFEVHP